MPIEKVFTLLSPYIRRGGGSFPLLAGERVAAASRRERVTAASRRGLIIFQSNKTEFLRYYLRNAFIL